jgi:DNA-binding PadR family transcriptional regulator
MWYYNLPKEKVAMHRREPNKTMWLFRRRDIGGFRAGFSDRGARSKGLAAIHVGKMLADGELRVVALALLAKSPQHGYGIIKALEEKSSGIYSPSSGVVYPTLTYLEKIGYACASLEGNKKVYAITPIGRVHAEDNREVADALLNGIETFSGEIAQARAWWESGRRRLAEPDRDTPGVLDEVNEARRELKAAILDGLIDASTDQQRRVAKILRDTAKSIKADGGREEVIDQ